MKKSLQKLVLFLLIIGIANSFSVTVNAKSIMQAVDYSQFPLFIEGNSQYYLEENELIKVEIQELTSVSRKNKSFTLQSTSEYTKEKEVLIWQLDKDWCD